MWFMIKFWSGIMEESVIKQLANCHLIQSSFKILRISKQNIISSWFMWCENICKLQVLNCGKYLHLRRNKWGRSFRLVSNLYLLSNIVGSYWDLGSNDWLGVWLIWRGKKQTRERTLGNHEVNTEWIIGIQIVEIGNEWNWLRIAWNLWCYY